MHSNVPYPLIKILIMFLILNLRAYSFPHDFLLFLTCFMFLLLTIVLNSYTIDIFCAYVCCLFLYLHVLIIISCFTNHVPSSLIFVPYSQFFHFNIPILFPFLTLCPQTLNPCPISLISFLFPNKLFIVPQIMYFIYCSQCMHETPSFFFACSKLVQQSMFLLLFPFYRSFVPLLMFLMQFFLFCS